MAGIKELYDEEVLAAILSKDKAEIQAEAGGPSELDNIPEIKVEAKKGQVKFSDIFWKPTLIPDIPLTKYERSDWHEEAQYHIPDDDPNWVWPRETTEKFALAMYCGDTTLLHGLQGTGKSCLPMNWCAALIMPFWRMNCNRETREGHFLGSPGVEYNEKGQMYIKQEPTALTDSLRYGGLFCEDEAFRHNAGLVLQSLREKNSRFILLPDAPGTTSKDRKLVAPEGKWWYVMTDNTCGLGDETGTFDAEVQDVSTLDRIGAVIEVDYLPMEEEKKILTNHSKLNDTIITGMVNLANQVRTAFKQDTILTTMSTRGLLYWAEKIELMGDIGVALRLTWYDKLSRDDQAQVKDIFHSVFAKNLTEK